MTESQYTASIGKKLHSSVHAWKINARFANGVPDTWYSGSQSDLWIEYKYVKKFPKQLTPKLSPLQQKWLNDRHAEGRNVVVIVGSPEGSIILEDGQWNSPTDTAATKIFSKKEVADYISRSVSGVGII